MLGSSARGLHYRLGPGWDLQGWGGMDLRGSGRLASPGYAAQRYKLAFEKPVFNPATSGSVV